MFDRRDFGIVSWGYREQLVALVSEVPRTLLSRSVSWPAQGFACGGEAPGQQSASQPQAPRSPAKCPQYKGVRGPSVCLPIFVSKGCLYFGNAILEQSVGTCFTGSSATLTDPTRGRLMAAGQAACVRVRCRGTSSCALAAGSGDGPGCP